MIATMARYFCYCLAWCYDLQWSGESQPWNPVCNWTGSEDTPTGKSLSPSTLILLTLIEHLLAWLMNFSNIYWWKCTSGWKCSQVFSVSAVLNLCISKLDGDCHAQIVQIKSVALGSLIYSLTLALYLAWICIFPIQFTGKVWLQIVLEQMWMFYVTFTFYNSQEK